MKKYNYLKVGITFVVALIFNTNANAQIKGNQTLANGSINNSTAFLDAASSTTWNSSATLGKGFLYPRADLTQLVLTNNGGYLAANNPNRFDGLIVYNTATGNTPAANSGIGNQAVAPGFYYFSNPGSPTATSTGQWIPLGGNPKYNVTTAETPTNAQVAGSQVYAKKGTFTTNGTSTAPTAYAPAAISVPASATASVYRVTIYKAGTGTVYDNNVYSYDITNGNLITGSPSMSVVYPAGTYDYVVEYIK